MAEPVITRRAAHDDGPHNLPINHITIHATCGGRGFPHESEAGVAQGTAAYFAKTSTQASAHYIEDVEHEEHCVPDDTVAWHAPPNKGSVGIEICGEATYTRDEWLSPDVRPALERAAARTRELCERFDVPKTKIGPVELLKGWRGVVGHVDVSNAWHETTHTDPGPGFPWDVFMGLVAPQAPVQPPTPPLPPPPPPAPVTVGVAYGQRSPAVLKLQQFMVRTFPAYNHYTPTGFYGDATKAGIAEFQFRAGVTGKDADGSIVGPRTIAALARFGFTF